MAESKLEANHQIFIVQQFAAFERPKDIQEALKQKFDIEISLQGVCYYDLDTNPDLPKKFKTIFQRTRKKFLDDCASIPISNKSYRLKKLQGMFDREESENPRLQNKKAMREILEQAARESGDAFSNRQKHEHTGKDGAELAPRTITVNVVRSAEIVKDEPDDKHQ